MRLIPIGQGAARPTACSCPSAAGGAPPVMGPKHLCDHALGSGHDSEPGSSVDTACRRGKFLGSHSSPYSNCTRTPQVGTCASPQGHSIQAVRTARLAARGFAAKASRAGLGLRPLRRMRARAQSRR